MTILKGQGQTISTIGIDLERDVFSHGQLYTAFSRATDGNNVRVYAPRRETDAQGQAKMSPRSHLHFKRDACIQKSAATWTKGREVGNDVRVRALPVSIALQSAMLKGVGRKRKNFIQHVPRGGSPMEGTFSNMSTVWVANRRNFPQHVPRGGSPIEGTFSNMSHGVGRQWKELSPTFP
ncbi:hypothetical protein niasHT_006424 [Heterodera trifolii]|uniref:Ribosomal protein L2 n=1 Tax=Heterodera trifolii TaxID=157864 RepID=A0ABD2M344_9BILA